MAHLRLSKSMQLLREKKHQLRSNWESSLDRAQGKSHQAWRWEMICLSQVTCLMTCGVNCQGTRLWSSRSSRLKRKVTCRKRKIRSGTRSSSSSETSRWPSSRLGTRRRSWTRWSSRRLRRSWIRRRRGMMHSDRRHLLPRQRGIA